MELIWTEEHYESLDWQDAHVHAFRIIESEHGAGELWFYLDYIVDRPASKRSFGRSGVVPAILVFREATGLQFSLGYEGPIEALGPFSLDGIQRKPGFRGDGAKMNRWKLRVRRPAGDITFESPGFEQRLTASGIGADSGPPRILRRSRELQ